MWKVFRLADGGWRGIAEVPDGNLRLRDAYAHLDARRRFAIDTTALRAGARRDLEDACVCGEIMSGLKSPSDCTLFGTACTPDRPVGACMVSSEGTCRIWHQYGGHPDLGGIA
jgi:hydrogenase expression/formation protein HypD